MDNNRRELGLEELEEVTGGMLKAFFRYQKESNLVQYDVDFNPIGTWTIDPEHLGDVSEALKSTYWSFEEGKRDEQCLQYFLEKGWIH